MGHQIYKNDVIEILQNLIDKELGEPCDDGEVYLYCDVHCILANLLYGAIEQVNNLEDIQSWL